MVWLAEDGVLRRAPLRGSTSMPFGRVAARERREHCRGEPGSILSGGYALDSAEAEDRSIVDEPGEGCTPVRENQRREPGGF